MKLIRDFRSLAAVLVVATPAIVAFAPQPTTTSRTSSAVYNVPDPAGLTFLDNVIIDSGIGFVSAAFGISSQKPKIRELENQVEELSSNLANAEKELAENLETLDEKIFQLDKEFEETSKEFKEEYDRQLQLYMLKITEQIKNEFDYNITIRLDAQGKNVVVDSFYFTNSTGIKNQKEIDNLRAKEYKLQLVNNELKATLAKADDELKKMRLNVEIMREKQRQKQLEEELEARKSWLQKRVESGKRKISSGKKKVSKAKKTVKASLSKPPVEKKKFTGAQLVGVLEKAEEEKEEEAKPPTLLPNIADIFPGALPNEDLCSFVSKTLSEHGYEEDNTLIATSLCCDEVNRPLETDLSKLYKDNFNMGGLAGFPFGGATSFGAMASHIPDGGSCVVAYGPHVGVDSNGNVGTVERRGRANGGACCGSAVAASNYVSAVSSGEQAEAEKPSKATDAQQYFVGQMLLPHAERLNKAENKMKELPYALYDAQTEMMTEIIEKSAGAVADGTIAVLGGIQINTPPGYTDYYLPLSFDLYNNKGELIENLLPHTTRPFEKVKEVFPGALSNNELVSMVEETLAAEGYKKTNSLVATSLCCDEVNRPLESDLAGLYDHNFNMGGLAGFPFGGATSFGAMASHIPDGGSCVVVYGPHVGVDSTGKAGTVERRGRANGGACCGSAVAASNYVAGVFSREHKPATVTDDALDAQQYFVGSMLMPHADRLDKATDKMVELPYALYDAQTNLMKRIVDKSCGAVADGTIAVLGGIQINTPPGFSDYYLPKSFKLYDNEGNELKNLLPTTDEATITIVDEDLVFA